MDTSKFVTGKKFALYMQWLPFTYLLATADKRELLEQYREDIMVELDKYNKAYSEYAATARAGVEEFARKYAELKGIPEKERDNYVKAMSENFWQFRPDRKQGLVQQYLLSEHPPIFEPPAQPKLKGSEFFFNFQREHFVIEEVEFLVERKKEEK